MKAVRSVTLRGLLASSCIFAWGSPALAQTVVSSGTTQTPAISNDPVSQQQTDAQGQPQGDDGGEVVVIGTRIGGGSAVRVKRDALQSVSVLTAEDIAKIPDTSVADVLRRVPGVVVNASGGGGIPTIRGLRDAGYLLNGRNLTSTVGRGYDAAALPSDLVSGIDVYKTPSASQIEGGIGGVFDFRTRRPLDFKGLAGSATAKAGYSDIARNVQPYLSGFISDRADTPIGEFGALIGGAYQKQATGQNIARVDNYATVTDGAGRAVVTPTNAIKRQFFGGKTLETVFGSLQWRPDDRFEFITDLLYNNEGLNFTNQSLVAQTSPATVAGAAVATPNGAFTTGANDNAFRSGSFANVPLLSQTNQGIGYFRTRQAALTGRYKDGPLTLSGDVSWTKTVFRYEAPNVTLGATAPGVSLDTGSGVPRFTVTGIDPTATAPWRYVDYSNYVARDYSTELAFRGDAIYEIGGGLKNIQVGVRQVTRDVGHQQNFVLQAAQTGISSVTNGAPTGLSRDGFWGDDYPQPRWLSPLDVNANNSRYQQLFGLPTGRPAYDPNQAYDATEKVLAGYGQLTFDFQLAGMPIDGNVGVRVARTNLDVTGVQTVTPPATAGGVGQYAPISASQSFTDTLPMVNVRMQPATNLTLRLAYSKSISRAPFYSLNPTLTLDFVNFTGNAGNPNLLPLRADQYDASLEWYFQPNSLLYVAGFYKDMSGYVRNQSTAETINGRSYLINRPQNLDSSWLAGIELGYQQRLTFLPGALSGFGWSATYTYIDDKKSDNGRGYRVGLEQLSSNNYVVAIDYDKFGVTGNIAFTRRGRILESSGGDSAGRPLYNEPFGSLDASLAYEIRPGVSILINGVNLTKNRQQQNFLDRSYFNQTFVEDRRIFGGIQVKFGANRTGRNQ